VLQTVKHKTEQ